MTPVLKTTPMLTEVPVNACVRSGGIAVGMQVGGEDDGEPEQEQDEDEALHRFLQSDIPARMNMATMASSRPLATTASGLMAEFDGVDTAFADGLGVVVG
jgi:hypothetical protein